METGSTKRGAERLKRESVIFGSGEGDENATVNLLASAWKTRPINANDFADKLADLEYNRAIMGQNSVPTEFPFEKLKVKSRGKKITGNLRRTLDNLYGENTAKTYPDSKGIVKSDDFSCAW